jgi:hypothetical protein
MSENSSAIAPIERLGYLLVYRGWFLVLFGALALLGAVAAAFIITEMVTTNFITYTRPILLGLLIDGILMLGAVAWGVSTEISIFKLRKEIVASGEYNEYFDDNGAVIAEK